MSSNRKRQPEYSGAVHNMGYKEEFVLKPYIQRQRHDVNILTPSVLKWILHHLHNQFLEVSHLTESINWNKNCHSVGSFGSTLANISQQDHFVLCSHIVKKLNWNLL